MFNIAQVFSSRWVVLPLFLWSIQYEKELEKVSKEDWGQSHFDARLLLLLYISYASLGMQVARNCSLAQNNDKGFSNSMTLSDSIPGRKRTNESERETKKAGPVM